MRFYFEVDYGFKIYGYGYRRGKKAFEEDEVPIGCVIVKNNQILALTHNRKEQMNSATKHAEILAIEEASSKLNNWRLDGCDVYITLEPCPMCASALKQARVSHIFCGLSNSDFRNYEIVLKILESDKNNASVPVINDLAVEKVDKIMKDFFRNRRNS